jgi:metal-dependent amidase/aminoacylase/carboxypeptidase family protein
MDLQTRFQGYNPDLQLSERLYQDLHRFLELSEKEHQTASRVAHHLCRLKDFEIHPNIGGHGIVGLLRNGDGSVVMLRAELEALLIRERIGLHYSSDNNRIMMDRCGHSRHVMHAYGHDMHMACLMGAAELLLKARTRWSAL